ncbi:MAG: bifunctional DNA primase/polymerase [Dehalococcoidia bacterium]|nr:bifunctional DNA primase/polymerase [Dehalococcoidia bacterium]
MTTLHPAASNSTNAAVHNRARPDEPTLLLLRERYRDRHIPIPILELASTPTRPDFPNRPSRNTRDETSRDLAWQCRIRSVPMETALALQETLYSLMDQPHRDEIPWAVLQEKVFRAYEKPLLQPKGALPPLTRGTNWRPLVEHKQEPWEATPVPFTMPFIDREDPERVRKLWDAGFAAIPVPSGGKGSARNPKFAHLKDRRPTEEEFKKFSKGWYKKGNAALLFGNENPGITRLYAIEVEQFKALWEGDQKRRDYFLANSPVMMSAKSAHIFITSDEVVHTTKLDGVVEFRGSNNYSMAPGSLHPSSSPKAPIVYEQINIAIDTILKVTNVPAFVHHYFPELFKPASSQPTADAVEEWEQKQSQHIRRQRRTGRFFSTLIPAAAAGFLEWPEYIIGNCPDREFLVSPTTYKKLSVLLTNPIRHPKNADLEEAAEMALGESSKIVERLCHCGMGMHGHCPVHGQVDETGTKAMCSLPWHGCPTDTFRKIASSLTLPNLNDYEGESYHTQRYARVIPMPSNGQAGLEDVMKAEYRRWTDTIARIAKRRRYHGKLLARSLCWYIEESRIYFEGTVMVQEDSPAQCDELQNELTNGELAMTLVGEVRTREGETAVMQLMEMAWRTLAAMEGSNRHEAFAHFYHATKGQHLFQGMSWLYGFVRHHPKEPPPKCPICGKTLRWAIDSEFPSVETAQPITTGPPELTLD